MRIAAPPAAVRILFLLALALPARAADEPTFLIVNPSGRGNQSLAQGFLADFAAALRSTWPAGSSAPAFTGRYHVNEADALASLKSKRPAFALLSTGFYLAHREELALTALVRPVHPADVTSRFHLVVATSRPEIAERIRARRDVSGLRIGGRAAGEPAWAERVVLHGLTAAGAVYRPQAKTLESVRQLQAGELDAVLLHDSDWRRLGESGRRRGLEAAWTSDEQLEGPVVAIGEPGDSGNPADAPTSLARPAAAALQRFPETAEGRTVLERMGLRGFIPVTDREYDPLAARLKAGGR